MVSIPRSARVAARSQPMLEAMGVDERGDVAAICVVVVTRDRPCALARCLAALAKQSVAVRIVVVDDGSADAATAPAVVAQVAGDVEARVIAGAGSGPATARNLGARAAASVIVCFTDDDCAPEPHWAQRLAAACSTGGAAAGTTVADPAAGRAAAASQLITHALQVASLRPASDRLGFAPTCNIACHGDVVRTLPFDESYPLAAGEDRDWCSRLQAAGVALRFVADATVRHHPRLGLLGLLRQQARYGRGAVRYRAGGNGRRLSGRTFYSRLARDAARAGPAVAALVVAAQAAVIVGAVAEAAKLRRSWAIH